MGFIIALTALSILCITILAYAVWKHHSVDEGYQAMAAIIRSSSDSIFLVSYTGECLSCCSQQHDTQSDSTIMNCFHAGRNIYMWVDSASRKELMTEMARLQKKDSVPRTMELLLVGDTEKSHVTLCPLTKNRFYFIVHPNTISSKQLTAMRDKSHLMEQLIENLPFPVSVKDMSNRGHYFLWNKKAEELYGIVHHNVKEKEKNQSNSSISQLFADTDRQTMLNGENRTTSDIDLEDGSSCTITLHKKLLENTDGRKWIVSTAQDITSEATQNKQLKKQGKELRSALHKADESNQLKSQFIANISHEIRTPLNAIVGFSQCMSESTEQEERTKLASYISSSANTLVEVVDCLLELSQIETGEVTLESKPVFLTLLVKEVLGTARWKDYPDIAPSTFIPEQDYVIDADRKYIRKILINFLTNALKYTKKGSIQIGYSVSLHSVRLFVKDTGIGIPKEKQQYIFNRFEKLGSMRQGMGLGLSLCKSITKMMDGTIGLDSEVGKGSTFWIELPYTPRPQTEGVTTSGHYKSRISTRSKKRRRI